MLRRNNFTTRNVKNNSCTVHTLLLSGHFNNISYYKKFIHEKFIIYKRAAEERQLDKKEISVLIIAEIFFKLEVSISYGMRKIIQLQK